MVSGPLGFLRWCGGCWEAPPACPPPAPWSPPEQAASGHLQPDPKAGEDGTACVEQRHVESWELTRIVFSRSLTSPAIRTPEPAPRRSLLRLSVVCSSVFMFFYFTLTTTGTASNQVSRTEAKCVCSCVLERPAYVLRLLPWSPRPPATWRLRPLRCVFFRSVRLGSGGLVIVGFARVTGLCAAGEEPPTEPPFVGSVPAAFYRNAARTRHVGCLGALEGRKP